jgi:hypothetical protein
MDAGDKVFGELSSELIEALIARGGTAAVFGRLLATGVMEKHDAFLTAEHRRGSEPSDIGAAFIDLAVQSIGTLMVATCAPGKGEEAIAGFAELFRRKLTRYVDAVADMPEAQAARLSRFGTAAPILQTTEDAATSIVDPDAVAKLVGLGGANAIYGRLLATPALDTFQAFVSAEQKRGTPIGELIRTFALLVAQVNGNLIFTSCKPGAGDEVLAMATQMYGQFLREVVRHMGTDEAAIAQRRKFGGDAGPVL